MAEIGAEAGSGSRVSEWRRKMERKRARDLSKARH